MFSIFETYNTFWDERHHWICFYYIGVGIEEREDIDDEAFQEQLAIDLEMQSADIRQAIEQMDMTQNSSTVSTSKWALSSLENESNTKKSSRLSTKK